jgi:hypothetical protein
MTQTTVANKAFENVAVLKCLENMAKKAIAFTKKVVAD